MPLRIAVLSPTPYESAPRVRRAAEALAARGDEVRVWSVGGAPAGGAGVEVERVEARSFARFLAKVAWPLTRAHARRRFDVLHVYAPAEGLLAAALPRLPGAKVLLDLGGVPGPLGRGRGLAVAALADAVVAAHAEQYDALRAQGVPVRKLSIVMDAADPDLFSARKKEPRVKAEGPLRLVCHGLLDDGVDVVLEAFARAKDKEPRLRLRVLGGGPGAAARFACAGRLGLSAPDLEMSGEPMSPDEIARSIRDAHLGLVPAGGGLPAALLEYMAVGIPTIASRTPLVARFVAAEHAELVPAGDPEGLTRAILRLAADKARRKALAEGAGRWQAEFGEPTQRSLLVQTVEGLCADRIARARQARQARVEGVKTGPRRRDVDGGHTLDAP